MVENNIIKAFPIATPGSDVATSNPMEVLVGGKSFTNNGNDYELEIAQEIKNEVVLSSDKLNSIKRRILIGLAAYGVHNPAAIAAYVGNCSKYDIEKFINDDVDIKNAIKSGDYAALTKQEIVARLSVEAEVSPKGADRISALKLLMEYRGLCAPEGGSKSFSRMVQKFRSPG